MLTTPTIATTTIHLRRHSCCARRSLRPHTSDQSCTSSCCPQWQGLRLRYKLHTMLANHPQRLWEQLRHRLLRPHPASRRCQRRRRWAGMQRPGRQRSARGSPRRLHRPLSATTCGCCAGLAEHLLCRPALCKRPCWTSCTRHSWDHSSVQWCTGCTGSRCRSTRTRQRSH